MPVELQENPTIKPVKKTRAKKNIKIETIETPALKEPEPPILREAEPLQYRITQEEQSSSSRYPAPPTPDAEPEPELQFELEDTDTERGPIQKVKKPRTPKQIEAFEKARRIRSEKAVQRKAEQDAMMKEAYRIADEEQKKAVKEMQDVIVEKAVKIKKNQIKKIKELDENSVDVGSINKIVNPYHEFRNKFNIR